MKPPEENIMNNLECNSSSLAIETSGVGLGVSGGLHQQDGPVIKSNSGIDKPIIDNKTLTNHKTSKTVIRVINGLVVSVTIMVTLLMRSSGRWCSHNVTRRVQDICSPDYDLLQYILDMI